MAGLDLCRTLADGYASAPQSLWRPALGTVDGGAAGHVFVVGFPRSGTTLLEQALAGHPDIVALEERPTLLTAIERYLDPPTGLGALADIANAARPSEKVGPLLAKLAKQAASGNKRRRRKLERAWRKFEKAGRFWR